jgi:hypothetical protein
MDAIQLTTLAFKDVLEAALAGLPQDPKTVYVGPPSDNEAAEAAASLFLYHLVPNADLRNDPEAAALRGPRADRAPAANAIPFDLRYLVTVFRKAAAGAQGDPLELLALGRIIAAVHAAPLLTGARLPEQVVRLSPDPISMEEISRVWGLFPETALRTSIVYLATPVFVDAAPVPVDLRVREAHRHVGRLREADRLVDRRQGAPAP